MYTRAGRGSELRLAGAMLFLAGSITLLGIISAEALYPAPYSTGANEISDLGGTRPPESVILQPSATIFNASMTLIGAMVIGASALVQRGLRRLPFTIPLLLLGVGALGVGVFPANTGAPHTMSAMLTFIAGGLACVAGALVTRGPFQVLSVMFGAVSLLALASYVLPDAGAPLVALESGGLERWVLYPIVLWITGFGGYLAGRTGE